ncbi:MAG: ABC transporter substrate-binding protein [Burkholderiales bacterium]|nr:ABC transporter substrate-binding protein [Burkholderiales bacterium]MDE2290267.1 ABC transporter substrate-binding protein [Burkholderiales bacterium]
MMHHSRPTHPARLAWLWRIVATLLLVAAPSFGFAQQKFTDWGWPLPYQQISPQSVQWLKSQGWWPLKIAYQAPWSGQNTINIVMDRMGLLKKRGVDAKFQAFASGPAINEVIVSGRFQAGSGGNFPFTSLIDKRIPVKAIAIESPNLLHALVVPNDSPLKSFKDLKGSNPPAAIGLVTGSSAEFYVQMAAEVNGVKIGKDIILKNMSPGDQMAMPKGLAAVASWDPTPTMIVNERKTGRIIDSIYPYNMYEGQFYVREEVIQHAPDVAQALSDAFVEATLWTRLHPRQAAQLMSEDPQLRNYSKTLLLQQIEAYNNLYKPTYVYPNGAFWGAANETIFKWLYQNKRIEHPLTAKDFEAAVDPQFMDKTFEKLGWARPAQPPFIPAHWSGSPDKIPYPAYETPQNLKQAQAFPQPGDLTKPWMFDGKQYAP